MDGEFRFGSARHLGEDPNGQWTLRLTDHFPEFEGTLRSWSIKVYGHVSRPGAPTITTPVTAGADSLTVAWSAPVDDGGPAITAYDLRYIQTSADETVDANWTLVEDVWMGSGPLNYIITGLTRGTQYDVQVRAVSADGDGPWSATATGTTGESDQEALVALYNATEGPNWANNTNWLSDKPLGEWHGVTTDANGRVTRLDLSQNGLTGEIPSGLGSLTNLDRLFLHRNQLTGEIPAELGNLTNLARLRLDGNRLTGTIPAELGRLTNLTVLYLSGNPLTGCVPASLRDVEDTDFAQLGLTFCTSGIDVGIAEDLSIAGDAAVSDYAEDQADTTVATYTVSGDNVATAMWSLPTGDPDGDGPLVAAQTRDKDFFKLEGTGQERVLKFKAAPNFEMPRGQAVSATNTNVYMVTLQVRHDDEDIAFRPVTITVTDVDELGMLSGDDSFSYAEGGTDAVGTYTLTAIGDGPTVTWSLDGTDKSDFMLEGTGMSRMLKFSSAPDYENPMGGADDDSNTYMVTVKASAGGEMEMLEVTVEVTNVDEMGTLVLSSTTPSVDAELTATLTDLDGMVSVETWMWYKSMDMTFMDGTETVIANATSMSYTPVADDAGYYLKVTVTYTDGEGSGKMKEEMTAAAVTAGDPLLAEYDPDGDGMIERADMRRAVANFFGPSPTLSRADMRRLVGIYFN